MIQLPENIRYVSEADLSWSRQKKGTGFSFTTADGKKVDESRLARVKKLGIPPAWQDVKICRFTDGHLQAVGLDSKQRKQYIYHPDWVAYNQSHKFDSLVEFGEVLPTLRETITGHMRQHQLTRQRILATVVWLLENTFIRIGNKTYEKQNQSYGLTTLRNKHVKVDGNQIEFSFKGKSGVYHDLHIKNPRVAKTVQQCIELPGYELFQYLDEEKKRQQVDSRDVNQYLQEITGQDLTAKDFRTWGGTTLAGQVLFELGQEQATETKAEKIITQAVDQVSNHLGNTTSVCRKYYIHPKVIQAFEENKLVPHFSKMLKKDLADKGLSNSEYATLALIKK